ncbi:hypothetical protein ERJ75_001007200 [Trypanosoma vivax]|nr:hypothetical protein ERJ75_001007200 [Trypanosoma vivax]
MRLQAKHGQPRREAEHKSLRVECKASVAHLECLSLQELRKKHGLETSKNGWVFFSAQLASFLKELFKLASPSAHTPDEQESRPGRAVKRHRSPTVLDTALLSSVEKKLIEVRPARAMGKRVREADFVNKSNLLQCSAVRSEDGIAVVLSIPCRLSEPQEQHRL